MQLQLISATGIKFDEPAYEVIVPTQAGAVAIYEDHMPLISSGAPGVLSVRKKQSDRDSDMEHFAVYGGIMQIDGKTLKFITDDITTSDEVSESEAKAALERAQALVAGAESRTALHEARQVVMNHEARLHLAQIKIRHHR